MNFEESILNIKRQLSYKPKIKNKKNLGKADNFLLIGMGGSALAGGIVKSFKPDFPLAIHKNYGLPAIKDPKKTLIIFSSYSGNTEETLSGLEQAKKRNIKRCIVSKNGKLLETAKKEGIPYIELPETQLQPRMALGFNLKALLKILNVKGIEKTAEKLDFSASKEKGKILSKKIRNFIPVIYSSPQNREIAYNWKIKLNENAKAPAFCGEIPESNHNEISGFNARTKKFAGNFIFLFLKDENDHERIRKRMEITQKIYKREGFKTIEIEIKGNFFDKYFTSSLLADYVTLFLAEYYGFDPEAVPTIERLKKALKNG